MFRSDSRLLLFWQEGQRVLFSIFQTSDGRWRALHRQLAATPEARVQIRYIRSLP
jgi:hypothetical protein